MPPGSRERKPALLSNARLRSWPAVQAVALLAAAALAFNGARILRDSSPSAVPVLDNFDSAMLWLGLALLATLVAAVEPRRLGLPSLPTRSALTAFWRAHRVEVLLFAAILAFGVFMRLYRFQDTLPPSNGLCCEENINGATAYAALQGQRPLLFLLVRWASAAGFLLFGETTLGLRFFFPIMSIATLALFYLLLRQLASVPAALFSLALYAAAWWPSLRARQTTEGTLYTVLFAFFLVRALKTKSPLASFGVGILAGLLSYEYEPFRAVPPIVGGILVAAALREVFLRSPLRLDAAKERALALLRVVARPALICLIAAGIVLVPLAVSESRGYNLYLTSVQRQPYDRGGQLLADEWQDQAKWAAELFLPFGPKDYPSSLPRDVPGTNLLDPLTASLAIVGLVVGAALILRGVRGLFVGWFFVSMVSGALVLQNFGPWKFVGLVPVLLVLVALLIDDVRSLLVRRYGDRGWRIIEGGLVLGVAFSFWWNADTLFNDVAPSPVVQASYGGESSMIYEMCHYLQDRGDENSTYAFANAPDILGFAGPRATFGEQGLSWHDFVWVCHDLQGTALPAPEEAWPLREVPPGPLTLAFGNPLGSAEELVGDLKRAYPDLGEPDRRVIGPAESYTFLSYEFASSAELFQHGLVGQYLPAGALAARASRVDPFPAAGLSWEEEPPPIEPPFTVRWRGLVYVDEQRGASLQAETDDPVEIRLDGKIVYNTRSGPSDASYVDLVNGWHPVEITLDKERAGGAVRLMWTTPGGEPRPVPPGDLFPLKDLTGWVHERAIGVPGERRQLVTQRLDFSPHYALGHVIKLVAGQPESFLTEERWRAVWTVDEPGDYLLQVEFRAGDITLLVDGAEVAAGSTGNGVRETLEAQLTLGRGRHTMELVQTFEVEPTWSGATIATSRLSAGREPRPVPLQVTPY